MLSQRGWMIFMADLSAEVCFAAPQSQALMPITVTQGTSIRTAVMASLLPSMFPDYDFSCLPCGVFGQVVDDVLQAVHHSTHVGARFCNAVQRLVHVHDHVVGGQHAKQVGRC